MTPAQWTALRYFAEAPMSNRTMASLARFQGMTLAPVTRTVKNLVEKGYVDRYPNPKTRRADLMIVNDAGKQVLEADPRSQLIAVIAKVPPEYREHLVLSLRIVLEGMLTLGLPYVEDGLFRKKE
ncbi:hypothetical protein CCP1ISM_4520001 [Azospirillaceae bacterium]